MVIGMNLREGRIGKQECASAALIGAVISGIFAMNTSAVYEDGNSAYVSSILAALAALGVFLLAAAAMNKHGLVDLYGLFRFALGRFFAPVASFVVVFALLLAAALPLTRLLLILGRFVYVFAEVPLIALYCLPCVVMLAVMGLESIGRTARLFLAVILFSLMLTFIIAAPAYDAYRLYPLLGNGLSRMLLLSLPGISRFFPPLCALLICGRGAQGLKSVRVSGKVAALGGGLITSASQLCLGMTYDYASLSRMHSPMFRATMAVNTSSAYLRTDKMLLFFWVIGGLIAGAFYSYAGALLHTRAFAMRDVRPAATAIAAGAVSVALLGNMGQPWFERFAVYMWQYLWALLIAPVLLASALALFRRRKV